MTASKIHYVYKITNLNPTDERLYYIGVRSTSKSSAELDTNYKSSSKFVSVVLYQVNSSDFVEQYRVWHEGPVFCIKSNSPFSLLYMNVQHCSTKAFAVD